MPNNYILRNSDDLHNYNAYRYLLALKKALTETQPSDQSSKASQKRVQIMLSNLNKVTVDSYVNNYPYGNLYSLVQIDLDNFTPEKREDPRILAFIQALYLNDNDALESTYTVIKDVLSVTNQSSNEIEHLITDRLNRGKNRSGNNYNPQITSSLGNRLYGVAGPNFAPQYTTGLPSIKHFKYQEAGAYPTEIRMGTQGQYQCWDPDVSNKFKIWLQIRSQRACGPEGIAHIYFNNLGRDRQSIAGVREQNLTHELEKLNKMPGVAVITLPACKGLFSTKHIFSTDKHSTKKAFTEQVTDIVMTGKHKDIAIDDIYIPPKIKKIIYKNKDEKKVVEYLLNKSFKAMGLSNLKDKESITKEQMQAIYFHFIKYELTDYILKRVNPTSFNIACKDGIDRAASASLFYNLMKSIDAGYPITQEEFERNFHGPATMVKGRGMNFHRNRVWSVINQYVNANYEKLNHNPQIQWLIRWRDINIPNPKSKEVFAKRSEEILENIRGGDLEIDKATRKFIKSCMELSKDDSYRKDFLMDMIYEAKSVAAAAQTDDKEKAVQKALKHMEMRIKAYPDEIKQLGFLEIIAKFFRTILATIFKHIAYESTKEKFISKNIFENVPGKQSLVSFSQFKNQAHPDKDTKHTDQKNDTQNKQVPYY